MIQQSKAEVVAESTTECLGEVEAVVEDDENHEEHIEVDGDAENIYFENVPQSFTLSANDNAQYDGIHLGGIETDGHVAVPVQQTINGKSVYIILPTDYINSDGSADVEVSLDDASFRPSTSKRGKSKIEPEPMFFRTSKVKKDADEGSFEVVEYDEPLIVDDIEDVRGGSAQYSHYRIIPSKQPRILKRAKNHETASKQEFVIDGIEDGEEIGQFENEDEIPTRYCCRLCDYVSAKRYALIRHMRSHSEDRPYQCHVCDASFKTKASLINHINSHNNYKPHQCKYCNYSSVTVGELRRHERYKHKNEKPHICPVCGFACVEASKLKRHMTTHTGERNYKCEQCSYAAADAARLKRHLLTHSGEKSFECDVCGRKFTLKNTLRQHKLIHMPKSDRKTYHCDICNKGLTRKTDIKLHKRNMHSEPVECSQCHEVFPDRHLMRQHKLEAHKAQYAPRASRNTLPCDLCDETFTRRGDLYNHRIEMHNAPLEEEDGESVMSVEVGNSTLSTQDKPALRKRRHDAESKPEYQCEKCEAYFFRRPEYVQHLSQCDKERKNDTQQNIEPEIVQSETSDAIVIAVNEEHIVVTEDTGLQSTEIDDPNANSNKRTRRLRRM